MHRLLKTHSAEEIIRRIGILFDSPPPFLAGSPPDIATLEQHFDKLVAPASAPISTRSYRQSPLEAQLERVAMLEREEALAKAGGE